jgi:hypothetical protein
MASEESGRNGKKYLVSKKAGPSRIIRESLFRSGVILHHLQVP